MRWFTLTIGVTALLLWLGVNPSALPREAAPVVDFAEEEAQATRWDRLRARFTAIATPLIDSLTRPDRPSPEESADRVNKARAAYEQASLAHHVAGNRLKEHIEGIAKQEITTAKELVSLSEADIARCREELEAVKALREKVKGALVAEGATTKSHGILTLWRLDGDVGRAKLQLERSLLELEQARTKLDVMTKYTLVRQESELRSVVEKKRSEMETFKAAWEESRLRAEQAGLKLKSREIPPEGRQLLVMLNSAVRWDGDQPPWDRGPEEFRRFLDGFETKLIEAERLVNQANRKRDTEQFLKQIGSLLELAKRSP